MERNRKVYHEQISDEDLSKYSCRSFEGEIELIDTPAKLDRAITSLSSEKILGFDTETKPSFRKGKKNKVALLQLATDTKAFLFRLNFLGLPDPVGKILSDTTIIKAGVAIHDDIKFLMEHRPFVPAGFTDLQLMAQNKGIKNIGLRKLSAIALGFKISKKQQVTDWEARALTGKQLLYAATDAWICYELFMELSGRSPGFK